MPWLSDLVESSDGSFSVLPVQCLCEVLLNSGEGDAGDLVERDEVKKRKQTQLLEHLQNILQTDDRSGIETLDYFLRRLGSHQTHQRLRALQGLRMVLSSDRSKEENSEEGVEMVMMEVEGTRIDRSNDWLLQKLPALPCFPSFYPQISHLLRNACQAENNPEAVSLYIQFLAHYSPDNLTDLADLCLDISTTIVERSTLFPAMLPGPMCKTSGRTSFDTYNSLLRLFVNYMSRARQQDSGNLENFESNLEVFAIEWADGSRIIQSIHFMMVVHAQIILLTYGPFTNQDRKMADLFSQLLSMWHPLPKAYLLETSDEVIFIPDWLKLKMIRSDVEVLVDSALHKLEPQQLVLFIQSFGIPVASMTKLLHALDRAVGIDFQGVTDAVMDKTYMGQLVSVQHERGARGGLVFAKSLNLVLTDKSKVRERMDTSEKSKTAPKSIAGTSPLIPPRSTAMIPPGHVKATLLHLFDVGSPSRMTLKEKQDTFRTLQKYLTSELRSDAPTKPMVDATVKALDQILKSSDFKVSFVSALVQRTPFSCALYRLISSAMLRKSLRDSPSSNLLLKVSNAILAEIRLKEKNSQQVVKSPLKPLLEDYVQRKGTSKGQKRSSSPAKRSSEEKDDGFEESIQIQVENALKRKQTKNLVESLAKMLLNEEKGDRKSGILMDWLQVIDPELTQASPDVKQRLMFSKGGKSHLMLTMMTHQANWVTLRRMVDDLLGSFHPDCDPAAVLDFLSTCVYLQKQWQCRDKHVPKHGNVPLDVLGLNLKQLKIMVEYAVAELVENPTTKVGTRVRLLVGCLANKEKAAKVVDYICHKLTTISQSDSQEETGGVSPRKGTQKKMEVITDDSPFLPSITALKGLLLHIYMKIPQCMVHLLEPEKYLPLSTAPEAGNSIVDVITHTLLSSLAATQAGRAWGLQMQEFECSLRKLAGTHPLLVLRNLPLIAASLKGRTGYDFSFFRSRNRMTFYVIMLGLLDLLSPLIFRDEYTKGLQESLICYFEMLKVYSGRRESMIGLVDKFVTFLHVYLEHKPSEASKFIRIHGSEILPDYRQAMGQKTSLKHLCEIVTFDLEDKTSTARANQLNYTTLDKQAMVSDSARFQLNPLTTSSEDLINSLTELKHVTGGKPGVLLYLTSDLTALICHTSRTVRTVTYELVLRLLRYSPKSNKAVVPAYLECLDSPDPGVVISALEKLPDLLPLAHDSLHVILETAFVLGVFSNFAVSSHIKDAIAVLNSQAGY